MYKLMKNLSGEINAVRKEGNGFVLSIPFDDANRDYAEYLEWLAEGNEPLPADPVETPA